MKSLSRSLVAAPILGAVLLLASFAAPAAAEAKTYRGESSQGFKLRLRTDDDRRVELFSMAWRAPCGREGLRYRARSNTPGPLDVDTGRRFSDRRKLRGNLKGSLTSTVVMRLRGRLIGSRSAEGTFAARVIIRDDGREIDRCRLPAVRWKAS